MLPGIPNVTTGQVRHSWFNAVRQTALRSFSIRNLVVTSNATYSTTRLDVKLDSAALFNGNGEVALIQSSTVPALNVTINTATKGALGIDAHGGLAASTWYYVWAMGKDSAGGGICDSVSAIASTSYVDPAMPSTWTHRRLLSCFATDSNKLIKPFTQNNDMWLYYARQYIWSKEPTTSTNYSKATLGISSYVPPPATFALIKVNSTAGASAPEINLYVTTCTNPCLYMLNYNAFSEHDQTWIQVIDGNIDIAATSVTGPLEVTCGGFIFPIYKEV